MHLLLEESKKNKHIIYNEESIDWNVCNTLPLKKTTYNFIQKFYDILEDRFNIPDSYKHGRINHEIINLNYNILNTKDVVDSDKQILKITKDLQHKLIYSKTAKFRDIKSSNIIRRINILKLIYPKVSLANQYLFYLVKLINVYLIVNESKQSNKKDLPVTSSIIDQVKYFEIIAIIKETKETKDILGINRTFLFKKEHLSKYYS